MFLIKIIANPVKAIESNPDKNYTHRLWVMADLVI
jgi:hypothetical protein